MTEVKKAIKELLDKVQTGIQDRLSGDAYAAFVVQQYFKDFYERNELHDNQPMQ